MLAMSHFTLVLLVFMLDVLQWASVTSAPSQPPVTKTKILYFGDYDEDATSEPPGEPGHHGVSTTPLTPHECQYDPCVVSEKPCLVIAAQTGCYCPGLTGPEELPEAPQVQELKQGAAGEVEVHWCAPYSTVKFYKVVAEEGHVPRTEYEESSRNATVQGLKVGSRVCVVAVNDAGLSTETESSCARYDPQDNQQVALRVGVAAGCVGFLLLLSVTTLLLWRRKSCKKDGTTDQEGLRNPSYSASEAS